MNRVLTKKAWKILLASTTDPEPLVRSEGARLLGNIGDKRAVPALAKMLRTDSWYCKITAIYALGDIGDKRARPVLREMATEPLVFDFNGKYHHDMIRIAAAMTLARLGDASGAKRIADLMMIENLTAFIYLAPAILGLPETKAAKPLKDHITFAWMEKVVRQFKVDMRIRALQALPYFKTKRSLKLIKENFTHFSPYIRAQAAQSLLHYEPSATHTALLKKALKKEKRQFTKAILNKLLYQHHKTTSLRLIFRALKDKDYFIRATAADTLAELGKPESASAIIPLLKDPHFYTRLCAIEALEKLHYQKAGPAMVRMLKDPEVRVRMQAAKYLVNIGY